MGAKDISQIQICKIAREVTYNSFNTFDYNSIMIFVPLQENIKHLSSLVLLANRSHNKQLSVSLMTIIIGLDW